MLNSRYVRVFGRIGTPDQWSKSLQEYIGKRNITYKLSLKCVVDSTPCNNLTLDEQFKVLSALPNFHHWMAAYESGVKKEEYFYRLGKSPRNLIISKCDLMIFRKSRISNMYYLLLLAH